MSFYRSAAILALSTATTLSFAQTVQRNGAGLDNTGSGMTNNGSAAQKARRHKSRNRMTTQDGSAITGVGNARSNDDGVPGPPRRSTGNGATSPNSDATPRNPNPRPADNGATSHNSDATTPTNGTASPPR